MRPTPTYRDFFAQAEDATSAYERFEGRYRWRQAGVWLSIAAGGAVVYGFMAKEPAWHDWGLGAAVGSVLVTQVAQYLARSAFEEAVGLHNALGP